MTSLTHPRLSGLGRNPAAPQDVLVRLAAHSAGRHGIRLRRGMLADAVVEALLTYGDENSAVGLHGDRVSPAMRRRIAEHPDPAIRDAYVNFVRDMVDRGVALGIDDLEEAYGRPRTALAGAPDARLRAVVAEAWHDRPLAVQVRLLADPDPAVRAAATLRERPGVPPEWRDRCLADPAVRVNAARHVPLTPDWFARLMRSGDEEVFAAVAKNPHLSAEMVAQLLEVDDLHVRVAVTRSRHVDEETRARIYALVEAKDLKGSIEVRMMLDWGLADPDWLREAPVGERMRYLESPHTPFRRVLASCRDLPAEAWQRLDNDPDLSVRRAAARRPDTPPEVLERLVRTDGDPFHLRPLHVDHPNYPRRTLRSLADEENPHVRCVALQDPELPVAPLRRLASADESFLRRGVAAHPNVPDVLLAQLLSDPEAGVAEEAAANPVLRVSRMSRILAAAGL
ncbi:hypothetical protein DMB38_30390 [Streptomyces sp. WAC 06738]|uniref:hypothetical protein n=1 Tax=Streptomyces sp. WAC 06738 TaxID=2203210 RepID=UPI000F6E65BD|nr:hypothetical protein [Streptomyces sp. WAC 06738]AZM49518.1 hypothetical protein DMB38_30390 [Streptomyces sp. WAC 06738]